MTLFKILCNFHVENLRKRTENLIHDKKLSEFVRETSRISILSAEIFTESSFSVRVCAGNE